LLISGCVLDVERWHCDVRNSSTDHWSCYYDPRSRSTDHRQRAGLVCFISPFSALWF